MASVIRRQSPEIFPRYNYTAARKGMRVRYYKLLSPVSAVEAIKTELSVGVSVCVSVRAATC